MSQRKLPTAMLASPFRLVVIGNLNLVRPVLAPLPVICRKRPAVPGAAMVPGARRSRYGSL